MSNVQTILAEIQDVLKKHNAVLEGEWDCLIYLYVNAPNEKGIGFTELTGDKLVGEYGDTITREPQP